MRNEYPRPDFIRQNWLNLNGTWEFTYGGKHTNIQVPFVCQSKASGIGQRIGEDHVVYERRFTVPAQWKNQRIILNFGAVDYACKVYINTHFVGGHIGGQTSFSFDITPYLSWDTEELCVEVDDPLHSEFIPRGKQFWEDDSQFIWYTPSTGIWQTVWIEPVNESNFSMVHFTPDIDEGTVKIDYELSEKTAFPANVHIVIQFKDEHIFDGLMACDMSKNSLTVDVFRRKAMAGSFHFTGNYWSPEHPNLYDVNMELLGEDGTVFDSIYSYFGMRKIHAENGRLYLNNRPYIHKLILDQGYWKDGLISAVSDSDYKNDILMCKEMGFNGCRKHEKVEDPRFLYWADHLGFMVWESMASFWSYTPQSAEAFTREWIDTIERDYNHPCIVVWGMLNESWGVGKIYSSSQQQAFANSLYYLAKAIDPSRLVISNDGWEMCKTDICAIHTYSHGKKDDVHQHRVFRESLKNVDQFYKIMEKLPFIKNEVYAGQPIVVTECGGIALRKEVIHGSFNNSTSNDWGYTFTLSDDFLSEYRRIISAIYDSEILSGFCYTQLSDIEQEKNGLLTEDHIYKFDPMEINKINSAK